MCIRDRARYVEEASRCCEDIISRGKLPVVVGGTGLYIDSLISGRDFAANDGDEKLREELLAEYDLSLIHISFRRHTGRQSSR